MEHNKHERTQLCDELQSQLPDYLDGDAKDAVCRAIEEHLATCDDCRVVVDTMKKTISLYRNASDEDDPSEVHARLVRVLKLDLPDQPSS